MNGCMHFDQDVVIVGGGLAGSLAAWRIAALKPQLSLSVIEAAPTLGGTHTWSFHDSDLDADTQRWIEPLVVARWPRHEVRFPGRTRVLHGGYASITAARLHHVIADALGDRVRFNTSVAHVDPSSVTLASGATIRARLVVDARGFGAMRSGAGWQTFVGQDLELDAPHGVDWPVLMDATVPQLGGFRFVYLLPWTSHRLLVEDTLYGDQPEIDPHDRRQRIAAYAERQGWRVRQIVREEHGALPLPFGGTADSFWVDRVPRIGVRAGLFHPTTGYSLPDAAATADLLAGLDLDDAASVYETVLRTAMRAWHERGFFRLLNRLLFHAAHPSARIGVLDQFYRRPEPVIARFYAAKLNWLDRVRLLSGRPPVPLLSAVRAALHRSQP